MNDIIIVNKLLGQTPLQAIDQLRLEHPELGDQPITYAGRLDPMAEGVLVLLKGAALHQKDEFLGLDKAYTARVLLGFKTDTYDILGMPNYKPALNDISQAGINDAVKEFKGAHSLPLPPYSSQPVQGKPLFQWARENRLEEITIPEKSFTVYDISLDNVKLEPWTDIYNYITQSIALVSGDFRQPEILKQWEEIDNMITQGTVSFVHIAKITIHCSSGTYIRSIAHELGQQLNAGALLLSLKRTKVGTYSLT